MTTAALNRTWRTAWKFTASLIVFLIVFDVIVIIQQNRLLYNNFSKHAEQEFGLFGELIASSLTKGDYANIEQSVNQWGHSEKTILDLQVIASNGFVIADFSREIKTTDTKLFHGDVHYGQDRTASIRMLCDISEIRDETKKLSLQLVSFSIVLVTLLGFLIQRTAVRPLQEEINEHEQTEIKLRRQAKTLREINNELESFSYSLSHDLRAPLRSITGFSQIILEEADKKLDTREKEYFDRILAASKRMAELIDDMLNLSRVTRSDLHFTIVDLSALAHDAKNRILESNNTRQVEWIIHDGLTAFGDRKLLTLLFDNLIGNAYKYSARNAHARIEFGSEKTVNKQGQDTTVYFIRDNGIGFDMQYANKLFKPFQRLHKDPSFEGTGVGLATVQRVVHRHYGRIWAEAEPDKGACFYFTLGDQKLVD